MKFYIKILPVLLAIAGLTGCKTDDVDYLADLDNSLNLKVTDIVYVLNEEKMDIKENTLIIPYFRYSWSSSNEDVAYIENDLIKAVGVGNTTITFKSENDEILKKVDINVKPTYEISIVSGQTLDLASVIPNYSASDAIVIDYNPKNMDIVNKQYVKAGVPSVTNFKGLTTINGILSYTVFTILPYEGVAPFVLPDVVSSMDIDQVKEVMAGYELTEEGDGYVGYSPYGKYLTYSPYGNDLDIKFNFQPERYDQPPYHIYNFVINTNYTLEEVLGYLFTNYEYGWTPGDNADVSDIFEGKNNRPYFQLENNWKVFSNPNDYDNLWTSLVFAETSDHTTGLY